MDAQSDSSCAACCSWWRLPLLLALVLAAIFFSRNRLIRELPRRDADYAGAHAAGSANAREHVSLAINFGDGHRKSFDSVAWHKGITVADALSDLPNTSVRQKGSGETAFLVSIDDVANDDGAGRYWTYRVNGKIADRSFAIYELEPGDDVLWTFGPRQ